VNTIGAITICAISIHAIEICAIVIYAIETCAIVINAIAPNWSLSKTCAERIICIKMGILFGLGKISIALITIAKISIA